MYLYTERERDEEQEEEEKVKTDRGKWGEQEGREMFVERRAV